MDDLISRKALIDYIKNWDIGCGIGHDQKTFLNAIEEQPSIKAVPVVRGEWIDTCPDYHNGVRSNALKCSICGDYYTTEPEDLFFCPRCGADMRKKTDGRTDKLIDAFCRTGRYETEPLKQYGIDLSESFGNTEQVEIVPEEEWREIERKVQE